MMTIPGTRLEFLGSAMLLRLHREARAKGDTKYEIPSSGNNLIWSRKIEGAHYNCMVRNTDVLERGSP
jgi:hypothetical protein